MSKPTPGPWRVREHRARDGELLDCFVAANDVNGFSYDAEIMGDDEYRSGVERKFADARLIAAAPELLEALDELSEAVSPSREHPASFGAEVGSYAHRQIALMNARAVIAKATGQ